MLARIQECDDLLHNPRASLQQLGRAAEMSHVLLRSAEQLPHDDRNRLQEQMNTLARLSRSLEAEHERSTHVASTVEECSRLTHAVEDILNEVTESAFEDEREHTLQVCLRNTA